MPYFHLCRTSSLEIGQTIELDYYSHSLHNDEVQVFIDDFLNGGLSRHGKQFLLNQHESITRELALELIRREYFPHLPSRFQCMFACNSIDYAIRFATNYVAKHLEVGSEEKLNLWLIDSTATPHIADMNHLKGSATWIEVLASSKSYWEGRMTRTPLPEVLLPLPVTVIEHVGTIICTKKQDDEQVSWGATAQVYN